MSNTRTRWEHAQTIAAGIRVPQAIGDFLILRAVRESGGFAIAVSDDAIAATLDEAAREEGFLMCPEGAATYAAYKQSLADGRVKPSEQAVLFNCAIGLNIRCRDPPQTRSSQADRFRRAGNRSFSLRTSPGLLTHWFFAWIYWQRRILVRWEYYTQNFLLALSPFYFFAPRLV